MKKTTPLKIIAAGGAAYAALGFTVFYEIMDRRATIPTKVFLKSLEGVTPGMADDDERIVRFLNYDFKEFQLTNADGHKLHAYFLEAEEPSDKYIVCAHGYRSNSKAEFRFAGEFLHKQGYNLLLVDHRAAAESEGKYITFGYKEAEDTLLWVQFLNDRFGEDITIGLYGVSMGSATVSTLTGNPNLPDNVKFCVADCGYTSVKDEFTHCLKSAHVPTFPIMGTVDFINRTLSHCSLDDMSPIESVKNSKVPTLFIHGSDDKFVPTKMVYTLFDACPAPKDMFIAEGAAHAESYQRQTEKYEKKFIEFTEKYTEEKICDTESAQA